jgi:hypothetical protein
MRQRTTALKAVHFQRTGHNRCLARCEVLTDDETRYPGTAPARSKTALNTHEL